MYSAARGCSSTSMRAGRPGSPRLTTSTPAALERARAVRDWLAARGWPAPLLADSGNGGHLVYGLELPNDAGAAALVRAALDALALEFSDGRVAVDRMTYNAARISKLYGTAARKGADALERPHRVSRMFDVPARRAVVPREALAQLAALVPPVPSRVTGPSGHGYTVETLDAALAARGMAVSKRKPWGGDATLLELAECPWGGAMHPRSARLVVFESGAVSARCFHNSCADRGWRDARELLGLARARVVGSSAPPTSSVWSNAKTAGELLAAGSPTVDPLDFPIAARGSLTAINAPRGTGKSAVVLGRVVALARTGLRVLYLDRDNSPATLRKRLRGLGAGDVPTLRVLTRDEAPPFADTAAWAAFPLEEYDLVVVDSWDAFAEGVGEQDSRRSTLALATVARPGAPRAGPGRDRVVQRHEGRRGGARERRTRGSDG